MYSKKDIIEKLKLLGCMSYETLSNVDENTAIRLLDFEALFSFIEKHSIGTAFYCFEYASAEDLQITESLIDEMCIDDEILSVVQADFENYNWKIKKLDFTRPYSLTVYCIYNNYILYVDECDYWFKDRGFEMPQKMARLMIEQKLDDIDNKKEEEYNKREELRNELKKKILADKEFHKCTNKELRRYYTQKLYNSDETHGLFYSPKHGVYDIHLSTFIEEVWREYKASIEK